MHRTKVGPGDNGDARPSATAPDGRNARGQFAPGNKHSRGNPFSKRQAELKGVILDFMTPDKMRELVAKVFERARLGHLDCIRLLFAYSLGSPRPAPEAPEAPRPDAGAGAAREASETE